MFCLRNENRTEHLNTSGITFHGTESFHFKPITPDHSIPNILNRLTIFWGGGGGGRGGGPWKTKFVKTLQYLRHNFPWDRLILCQTDNPWPSYSQDLNPPDYFVRGYLKERVCENNLQKREDIIRREIRWVPQEMLNRVVDSFNVWVAAVLSYSSVGHGTNIVSITEKV